MTEYIVFPVSTGVYWMWIHSPSQILVCMNHLQSEMLVGEFKVELAFEDAFVWFFLLAYVSIC